MPKYTVSVPYEQEYIFKSRCVSICVFDTLLLDKPYTGLLLQLSHYPQMLIHSSAIP